MIWDFLKETVLFLVKPNIFLSFIHNNYLYILDIIYI